MKLILLQGHEWSLTQMKYNCKGDLLFTMAKDSIVNVSVNGHESGELYQYSAKSGEMLVNAKEHSWQINDIQLSRDMTMFVTASKDNTAKRFDSMSLETSEDFPNRTSCQLSCDLSQL
ncbi:Eukaryotic translation initiation factor 3 subunit I [Microtus ochrogaster]|uniref:Eukaryotic translation initiation factor 3 subunit I n=1 Tax=Microtus ochrogaster TaxID=79684 RepID=A0A8J6GPY2_MICOH|nr:Eukaryotic translation initiation factor 3 subunit I [Microtus ochrogaster]